MDLSIALMAGTDIPIPECQLTLHQPRFKEIGFIGEKSLMTGIQSLCFYSSFSGKTVPKELKNFHIFMTMMTDKETADKKAAVKDLLSLLFPGYTVSFSPRAVVFTSKDNQSLFVDENTFDAFQSYLRAVFCIKENAKDNGVYNPADSKAREIAEKIMRGRQRVAEQRAADNSSVYGQYISILSVGLQIPVNQVCEYTIYQLYDQIERFQLYMGWNIDVQARIAGAKSDKTPENWMKNIH